MKYNILARPGTNFWLSACFLLAMLFNLALVPVNAKQQNEQLSEIDRLLQRANELKSADRDKATQIISKLEQQNNLSQLQQEELTYLTAYQLYLLGDRDQSIAQHKKLQSSTNVNNRIRANRTLLNIYLVEKNFILASSLIDELLDSIKLLDDKRIDEDVFRVIAYYYNELGAYETALYFLNLIDIPSQNSRNKCSTNSKYIDSYIGKDNYSTHKTFINKTIVFCLSINEDINSHLAINKIAKDHIKYKQYQQAKELLLDRLAEVEKLDFPNLTFNFYTNLANASFKLDEFAQAELFANKALNVPMQLKFKSSMVSLYQVLFQLAQRRGDDKQALEYLDIYQQQLKAGLDIEQNKALARAQIEHSHFGKKHYKKKLAADLKIITKRSLQASAKINEYEQGFFNNRIIFATQLGIILLLGFSLLYFRHLQISTEDINKVDSLTGLYNRSQFIDLAVSTISRQIEQKHDLALTVVNIDGFRGFNQQHGIISGDQLLVELAKLLKRHVASLDDIGRMGADEFVLVLPKNTIGSAMLVAEKIQQQIANLANTLGFADGAITVSIAVSDNELSEYSLKYLMCDTSKALMKAKQNGGDQVYCFDSSMTDRAKFKVKDHGLKYYFEQPENIRS